MLSLANTYCALCILLLCGDYKLEHVNKEGLVKKLKLCQRDNGCFSVLPTDSETDMRFNYCACAISYMIDDWCGIDQEALKNFIFSCYGYQGGFAWIPFGESHAGLTYTALGSLKLMKVDITHIEN